MQKLEHKPQPMMIVSPNGHLFPVQSISAAATRLGQIARLVTGNDNPFLTDKGLQNLMEIGVTTFADGPMKGWRFYSCVSGEEQVRSFLEYAGVELATPQSNNPAIKQSSNRAIKQCETGTHLGPVWSHSGPTLVSSQDQSEITVVPAKSDNADVEGTSLDEQFERMFAGYKGVGAHQ